MRRGSTIRVFLATIVVMAMAVVLHSEAKVITTGLLALWLMDEGSGTTAGDSSGNSNDAAFVDSTGMPEWADGKFGGGLSFNQTGWVDTAAPVVVDTKGFTMGAWVKPGGAQKQWANIMSSHQEPPQRGISFEQSSNDLNVYGTAIGAGAWTGCGNTTFILKTDVWQHMVFVREDDGAMAQAYVDGVQFAKDQICGRTDPVTAATANFRIGNWILGSRNWNGVVDEAFVFNRALSTAEVMSIYNDGWDAVLGGGTAVSPQGKLVTSWADMKALTQ